VYYEADGRAQLLPTSRRIERGLDWTCLLLPAHSSGVPSLPGTVKLSAPEANMLSEGSTMPEYRVIPMGILVEWPSSFAKNYDERLAEKMAVAFERMAGEGWELVCTYAHPQFSGPGFAVFRRGK
jgi:hypothetical protein